MPLTLTPLGVRCNLQCGYCYENAQREAGNLGALYDIAKIKKAITDTSAAPESFVLFGGEPLLLPKDALEQLWAWGFERSGRNSLQTNGTLVDSEHIALFKKYNVAVGISIDGPGTLNDARWDHTLERTRTSTRRTEDAISLLCTSGRPPSLIVTLHRLNATGQLLDSLIAWFHQLHAMGVTRVGLHLLEVENEGMRAEYGMTIDENVQALLRLRIARVELPRIKFSLLEDLDDLLMGDDAKARCIWKACDPYTTPAVRGIGGHGERTKCGRVNKEGIDFVPSTDHGFERYIALHQTPQESGGCKGCRFFLMCRGQCPGTALDGDWRNRTDQCATWIRVFESIEQDLVGAGKAPLSLNPHRTLVEEALLKLWESGRTAPVQSIVRQVEQHDTSGPSDVRPTLGASRGPESIRVRSASVIPDRLSFEMNDFSRFSWVSSVARDVWMPKMKQVHRSILKAEWMSVAIGIRSAALLELSRGDLPTLSSELEEHDLALMPVSSESQNVCRYLNGSYSPWTDGRTVVAVGRRQTLVDFMASWTRGDHPSIAAYLGYPKCCVTFVERVCGQQSLFDTIWAMAQADSGSMGTANEKQVRGMPYTNVLLSSVGIRAVPHHPCSFRCDATDAFARELLGLVASDDNNSAHHTLLAMLKWPAEWSALHGIAEVKSPVFKLCRPTDSTASKYVVRWTGDAYPREGARGFQFPYQSSSTDQGITIPLSALM